MLLPSPDAIHGEPAELERSWIHQGSLVLKFVGFDSRTEAEKLQGWFVGIPEVNAPPSRKGRFICRIWWVARRFLSMDGGSV
jgi:ribosomal 30S subunit maturation factor RimM